MAAALRIERKHRQIHEGGKSRVLLRTAVHHELAADESSGEAQIDTRTEVGATCLVLERAADESTIREVNACNS
jgi:hypothetical protein